MLKQFSTGLPDTRYASSSHPSDQERVSRLTHISQILSVQSWYQPAENWQKQGKEHDQTQNT